MEPSLGLISSLDPGDAMTKGFLILVIHSTGLHAKVQRAHKMTRQLEPTPIGESSRQGTRFRADEIRVARCEVNYY